LLPVKLAEQGPGAPMCASIRQAAVCPQAPRPRQRVQVSFDPCLDVEALHRHLNTIPEGVRLTAVTSSDIVDLPAAAPTSGKVLRRDRIVAVSELLAGQFPDRYEFRVSTEQHDRHIRVDGVILHLGGSAKDAAKNDYFTISNLAPAQSTHAFLDAIIARATEWYGPSVRPHRRA
jgi:hypothetical protein